MNDIQDRVIDILSSQLGVSVGDITLEKNITTDLNADSLDIYEIVIELEEEFKVVIEDDVIDTLKTVNDIVLLVQKLLGDK
jgi:acyl carrier protein